MSRRENRQESDKLQDSWQIVGLSTGGARAVILAGSKPRETAICSKPTARGSDSFPSPRRQDGGRQ